MAFNDIELELYDGTCKLTYKDSTHRYTVQELDPDTLMWGRQVPVKGVTTILSDTLEKKGLQLWPMGLALKELFGFYDFTNEGGHRLTGFSDKNGGGTLWNANMEPEVLLPLVLSASKAWTRKQKQGSDVGSFVHAAIQAHVEKTPFEFTTEQYLSMTEEPSEENIKEFEMAALAYEQFRIWWRDKQPELIAAEALVYSRNLEYAGAFDGLLRIDGKLVLADWKTSNASVSAGAPQGAYYSYFAQSAAYAFAWQEMTGELVDDLLIVSCRKDGSFDTVYLSELGVTIPEILVYWESIVNNYRMRARLMAALANNKKEDSNV